MRGQRGDLPPCPAADTVGSYAFCKLAQHLYCSCAVYCAPMSTSTSTRYILLPARGDVCGAAPPSPTLCILSCSGRSNRKTGQTEFSSSPDSAAAPGQLDNSYSTPPRCRLLAPPSSTTRPNEEKEASPSPRGREAACPCLRSVVQRMNVVQASSSAQPAHSVL